MAAGRVARPTRAQYRCAECGWVTPRWVGRCGECQAWGSVELPGAGAGTLPGIVRVPAQPIAEVDVETARARPSGVDELDRVLGGGLVPGAVVLLAGEPGVGKSTLLLDVASRVSATGRTVLYVSGEESAGQVRLRAERIGALRPRLLLAAETDLATLLGHVEQVNPDLLVVDSVQTVACAEDGGAAGGVSQVREVAGALIACAKRRAMATMLVGHVTKDGSIAGPRTLEHLVDVVCQFEGDRHSRLRMLRAVKNRYGPTDEVGCFDLTESGIVGLADPSGLFLSQRAAAVSGTCVTVTLEGRRPLVTEVQALVDADRHPGSARRIANGLDGGRVAMLMAVLQRRCGFRLADRDIYVATVGGARLTEPSADLAAAVAVASAAVDRPVPPTLMAVGEVGLAGELRPVTGVPRRLAEALRLGFDTAVVPAGTPRRPTDGDDLRVIEASTLEDALARAHILG